MFDGLGKILDGIYVRVVLAGVVAQDIGVPLMRDDILRGNRDLSPASGTVDHICGDGVAGRVPAQFLHDVDAHGDRRAEMPGAKDGITLINVIRTYPDLQEFMHQLFHRRRVVVDAFEKDRLAPHRDAAVRNQVAGEFDPLGDFLGMIEVNAHPDGAVFFEQIDQFEGDPLRQRDRNTRPDAHEFHVEDGF